ncbi:DUF2625 domain-containing protein [Streptomyces tricolor]|nr:DUF2625 domain-containing protein [Streptomyces tricolor]
MREFDELADVADPGLAGAATGVRRGAVPVRVLPADADEGRRCLLQLQVTTRSVLGALTLHCGGLVLDDGWLRVYGAGRAAEGFEPRPGQRVSGEFDPHWHPAAGLVVGHDVLGGVFCLNGRDPAGSGRPGAPGQLTYFAPDTLEWEALDMGHSAWVGWLLSGGTERFYAGLRRPDWRAEVAALDLSQGLSVFPFLWSEEAQRDLAATSRRAVPLREVVGLAADFARRLGPADPGFLGEV